MPAQRRALVTCTTNPRERLLRGALLSPAPFQNILRAFFGWSLISSVPFQTAVTEERSAEDRSAPHSYDSCGLASSPEDHWMRPVPKRSSNRQY